LQDRQRSVVMRRVMRRDIGPAKFNTRHRRADDPVALLHPILRRVRQRTFVIQNPYVIPRVDKAAANLASEKMISLTDAPPVGAHADHRPARSRFFE
jgi:hypothetical protein